MVAAPKKRGIGLANAPQSIRQPRIFPPKTVILEKDNSTEHQRGGGMVPDV